ncbi:hypothetical protein LUZ60_009639 [Juncus effusus]|nr:hypothetical protein LUZ60_009639 [Juncus effusus]
MTHLLTSPLFLSPLISPSKKRKLTISHFSSLKPKSNSNSSLLKPNSRGRLKVTCASRKHFQKTRAFINSLDPIWKEGLFLVRCSVAVAVISVTGILTWYAQMKAQRFVEMKLLPSVCSILSEYLQRELDFGKVKSVSPLGITLQSCSIGPHKEEFSCGEVETVKLRIRPFASLRRGKIVINAFVSQPCLLVSQKKDFSWLGLPSVSETSTKRNSTEEGIDHRTKSRRIAREISNENWYKERDQLAKEAAENGYVLPKRGIVSALPDNNLVQQAQKTQNSEKSSEYFCTDQEMHTKETRIEYGSKHADLEGSFGIKTHVPVLNFWDRVVPNFVRNKLKRSARSKLVSENSAFSQQMILRRSSLAALRYFKGVEKSTDSSLSSNGANSDVELNTLPVEKPETSTENNNKFGSFSQSNQLVPFWPCIGIRADEMEGRIRKFKSVLGLSREEVSAELAEGLTLTTQDEGIEKMLPVTLDSVYFNGGTLMLLGYGDQEPREMRNTNGYVKFQNHYDRIHVHASGDCMEWRQEQISSQGGGRLSTDVFVDLSEQKWHVNLNVVNLFAPLFERILEIPISLSKGRATGEVHICMSKGDNFPSLHGQIDVRGVSFHILDSPSSFSELTGSLGFRGQRVFLHNTSGWFGAAPLEASGDFGINPDDGEFHIMCQVPSVEINALMKTLKMKPLMFPVAGSVTAIVNCQGPLDAPVFVGSGIMSRKSLSVATTMPPSDAAEAVMQNKEAGAVAAFDKIPFSHVSANFTFNLDNCVADLYGIRASLLDGGEIRGAGNAWVCLEGEVDEGAMDVNLSGSFSLDEVLHRYIPGGIPLIPLKVGEINGDTRISGPLLKPKLDIKWTAPNAEDSFADARGNIIISHDNLTINSSSVAFDLKTQVQTSYIQNHLTELNSKRKMPLVIEGLVLDLRMRGFEFASFISSIQFDSPRPQQLKATGRVKFNGKVFKSGNNGKNGNNSDENVDRNEESKLVGDISLSGIKLNQLTLAPQSTGFLSIARDSVTLNANGRPDENLSLEVMGPLSFSSDDSAQKRRIIYFNLHKGQLKVNASYHPENSTSLEVRNLPLDELELASLRGIIQKAELQLNFQKRRGHGLLSVLRPKFSGVLGEALDLAARWSGDVITIEKSVLEQSSSKYELQGEYVLPGTRERSQKEKGGDGLMEMAMAGHLSSVMSSVGRWRMRLEVPFAEVAEMLPLLRLLSRSTDPAVRSRSKELFVQSLQSLGFYAKSLHDQLKAIQTIHDWLDESILEDITLPGLAELKGRWHGSLDASGGGNGDTLADFDFHGEDWEWGASKTQKVSSSGSYSNNQGLRLDKLFIQKDNATLHADGTLLGPVSNLHFAVLNFPVGLIPTVAQIIESNSSEFVHNLRQWVAPVRGILHMEGDLRGSLARPECDVQIRLLDGTVGGVDLGKAEVLASVTPLSRFVFSANFEPVVQSGHVHIQGSLPVTYMEADSTEGETDKNGATSLGIIKIPVWAKESTKAASSSSEEMSEKRVVRDGKVEEGWEFQLAESLKGLNWNKLDPREVRVNTDIKDGGMMLLTALCPYANWLHGYADILLQVTGTVDQPVLDGSASFHRASVSSPVLRQPLTNFGGTVNIVSNRLCISHMESRVSRKGKISLKGNLPLVSSESSDGDKLELKCEVLEVRAKNILSGQVDSQLQVRGSILQPNISGMVRLSHGEAYLPHDKGNGALANQLASAKASYLLPHGYDHMMTSGNVSRFLGSLSASSDSQQSEAEKSKEQESGKHQLMDVRLADLKLTLGPELRIVYPLILNFAVSGELELDGTADPKGIKPKGVLSFENGEVNLVATQVRLKRDHLNVAKFEPDLGLDPILDLVLVGAEWQFKIQSRASTWQENLAVTSTRSIDQDVLSPTEAAKVFETQLAESLLEADGQLAFKKLASATLETLMPRIEGKGEFGQARWRLVYAPQIPSLLSLDPTVDPLKSLANNISFATEVEVQLGKRLQASVVRQMKDSEMAMQWTLTYQLTSRLRVLYQSTPSNRFLFEYSATSQD